MGGGIAVLSGCDSVCFVVWPGVRSVYVEENVDKEVEKESDRVENEDVRDVGDVVRGEELHLLFGGGHEKETGGVEKLVRVST